MGSVVKGSGCAKGQKVLSTKRLTSSRWDTGGKSIGFTRNGVHFPFRSRYKGLHTTKSRVPFWLVGFILLVLIKLQLLYLAKTEHTCSSTRAVKKLDNLHVNSPKRVPVCSLSLQVHAINQSQVSIFGTLEVRYVFRPPRETGVQSSRRQAPQDHDYGGELLPASGEVFARLEPCSFPSVVTFMIHTALETIWRGYERSLNRYQKDGCIVRVGSCQ